VMPLFCSISPSFHESVHFWVSFSFFLSFFLSGWSFISALYFFFSIGLTGFLGFGGWWGQGLLNPVLKS
jgi:hypothetical protein